MQTESRVMCHKSTILRSRMKSVVNGTKLKTLVSLPGPKRLSLLGPLNEVIQLGNPKTLHQKISKYHKKFGPLFKIKMSETTAVFIEDPDMMRSVFEYEGKHPKHPVPEAWTYFNRKHNCKRGLFFMDNEEWFYYRKLLNEHIMRDVDWMKDPIKRICDKTVTNLPQYGKNNTSGNQVFEIHNLEPILYKWSVEVILCIMLGSSYNDRNAMKLNDMIDEFSNVVYQIFQYSSKLMTVPPYLADRLQLNAWRRFEEIVPKTLSIANKIIDTALDDLERGDGLLSKLQESIPSREDVKRIFADFIIAAGDTTSFSTLWCLYLLAQNEPIQEQIRTHNTHDNFKSPLIRGTIKEALRLFPVAPFIGRVLEKDAIIGDFLIPKNTLAILSLYTAGRARSNFYNPNEFLPQRWIRDEFNNTPFLPFRTNASLPFAIGIRSCIGRRIAMYQMQFLISKILKTYCLTIMNGSDVEAELKLVTVPNTRIKMVFQQCGKS
ncbi:cytochrome P450 315a1, mitochondrial [Malaya genurostris]|uniref:cytochrome P450 315a1, mitochondrial n=1 Tax=Malaya genurostris TaxID=325434 RepID=UPI0026F384D9|nr:cytochrome P450 315a1, mitochondrial [Malaya genurostris]